MVLDSVTRRVRTSGDNPALKPQPGWFDWGSRTSTAGPTVTDEKALGLVTFYRGLQLIASTAASLPLHVFEETEDGTGRRITSPETAYLWRRPNPEMTKITFLEIAVGHEVIQDAFIFVVKNENGGVATEGDDWGIWPIEPWRVRVGRTRSGRKVYELDNELPMVDYKDGGEIVHIPNFGQEALRGINIIRVATEALGLGLSAQEYAANFYSQGSVPPGVLSTDQVLSEEQADKLEERWQRRRSGLMNKLRVAVLGHGAKFEAISVNPADAQLLESRKFSDRQVATLLGIPPHLLGDVERSTSWGTGIEEQTRGWLNFGLMAHLRRVEQAIDDALLVRELTDRYAKFNLDSLLRPATLQRYQAYALAYGRWMTPNELRALEELPPIDGGDLMPAASNLIPLEKLGANFAEQPAGEAP